MYKTKVISILICSLFENAVSNSQYTASNDWLAVNNRLYGMCKGKLWLNLEYYPTICLKQLR